MGRTCITVTDPWTRCRTLASSCSILSPGWQGVYFYHVASPPETQSNGSLSGRWWPPTPWVKTNLYSSKASKFSPFFATVTKADTYILPGVSSEELRAGDQIGRYECHASTVHPLQSKNGNNPMSIKEWMNKVWHIQITGYDSAIKTQGVQIHAKVWTNHENLRWKERNLTPRAMCHLLHPHKHQE